MQSSGNGQQILGYDDAVAVSVLYDTWERVLGNNALDIGVGAEGSVWIVGENNDVFKWLGVNSWGAATLTPAQALIRASRISVGLNGVPWFVETNGNVRRRTANVHSSGSWELLPAIPSGADINTTDGVGAWVVANDGRIYKWDGSVLPLWREASGGGRASAIAVAGFGIPYIIDTGTGIWRRASSQWQVGTWAPVPSGGAATDIAAYAGRFDSGNLVPPETGVIGNNIPFVVGTDSRPGGSGRWTYGLGHREGHPPHRQAGEVTSSGQPLDSGVRSGR
jgi:hypothetical protein